MTLEKVKSGDPLKIPAATFNTFIDAARDFRTRTQNRGQKAKPAVRQSGIALVRNITAVDLTRMMVVALGRAVIAPADNEDEWLRRATFDAAGRANTASMVLGALNEISDGSVARLRLRGTASVTYFRRSNKRAGR